MGAGKIACSPRGEGRRFRGAHRCDGATTTVIGVALTESGFTIGCSFIESKALRCINKASHRSPSTNSASASACSNAAAAMKHA